MKKPNNQLRVKIIGNIHIDHSPYFEFDGTLTYDTDWMDEDPKSDEYMAEYKFRFHPLSTEEDMEFQKVIKVDISRFYRAKDMIKRATLLAFKNDCYEYYMTDVVCHEDDIDFRNNRVINIVGLTNHHTIEKLWKHALYSLISDEESIIYDGEVEKYRIINNDVYSGDEWVGSIMDGCDDGKKVTLTYDGNWDMFKSSHHVIMKNVTCFSDLLDAYRQLPVFYNEYLTEGEQRKEAVKRLGILGVSEKEIELFKEEGIIPIIEDSPDGIRRGEECQSSFSINWREHTGVPGFFRELEGRLPYLIFDSRGAIPMAAVLFVEDKREETESFQAEFSRNTDELMLSALGTMAGGGFPNAFFFCHDTEYGEIMVRLTEEGPIRVE